MPLYKREYPQWYEKTWNPNAVEKIKTKDQTYDKEKEEEEEEEEETM